MKRRSCIVLILLILFVFCNKVNTEKSNAELTLAVESYIEKDLLSSEKHLMSSLEFDPDNKNALLLLLKIYFFKNEKENFLNCYNKNIKEQDNYVETKKIMAQWLIKNGEIDKAIQELVEVEKKAGGDIVVLFLLSNLYNAKMDYQKTIEYSYKAFGSYPYLLKMHENLLNVYEKTGLKEKAEIQKKMMDSIKDWEGINNVSKE